MLSLSMTSYSQKDTTKSLTVREVYEDAKTGFKDAFVGLKAVAEKLEGPAKHVYSVYVHQHRTRGISYLVIMLFFLVIGMPLLFRNVRLQSRDKWDFRDFYVITGVLFTIIGMFSLGSFFWGDGYTMLTNPEYYAIQDVIKAFK